MTVGQVIELVGAAVPEETSQRDTAAVSSIVERLDAVIAVDRRDTALDTLKAARGPILVADRTQPIGWLTHHRVLAAQRSTDRKPSPAPVG